MFRRFSKTASIVVVALLGCAGSVAGAPMPQADENIAQARQHYQNAAAAIAKSDWQTAKNELLQAEKLAPSNSLVHYDLALTYSHIGLPKSARVEFNKALQLGLPAEQRQTAGQLREKLATEATKAHTSNPSGKTAADKAEHSTADIVGWIVGNSHFSLSLSFPPPGQWLLNWVSDVESTSESDNCLLSVHYEEKDDFGSNAHWQRYDTIVAAGTLDPEKIEISDVEASGLRDRGLRRLILNASNNKAVLKTQYWEVDGGPSPRSWEEKASAQGYPKEGVIPQVLLFMTDEDLAGRMKKAFGDLIRQCGGKPSAGEIY